MRTTIDIPDETYRAVRVLAAERGMTVRALMLEGLELVRKGPGRVRKPFKLPLIESKHPGTLNLTNEEIYDLIDFP